MMPRENRNHENGQVEVDLCQDIEYKRLTKAETTNKFFFFAFFLKLIIYFEH